MKYFVYCRKSSEAEDRQVASIESQLTTLQRSFGDRPDIEIVQVYEEAFSAKAPGRPQFGEMLTEIERGTADGIIAWAPDRLARNSIDGGRIVYMLDRGVVKDLNFATYTFENNSQGKFMLQIMFGQSKYYSDALSENVKRGNRTKLEKGWRPNQAPLGYQNDPTTKTIIKDPVHFPIVRRIFDLMLSGAYSPKQIALMARDEWGFRTPKRKRIGGRPLAMSSVYKMLSNPFYAGLIVWGGHTYPGKHEPVVTIEEFTHVRELLARPARPRPKSYRFAFTGMIRCGGCGLSITAEHKTNRYGSRYVYYHCVRPRIGRCGEPSVEQRALDAQIARFLESLEIDQRLEQWIFDEITHCARDIEDELRAERLSLQRTLSDLATQLNELTGLRVRGLLTDAEYIAQRKSLLEEQGRLQMNTRHRSDAASRIEPLREVISFRNRAMNWFLKGSDTEKRMILEIVASNLSLKGKIISIQAKRPFSVMAAFGASSRHPGVVDQVRTKCPVGKKRWFDDLVVASAALRDTEQGEKALANIRTLRLRFEPEVVAKEDAGRARRAKALARVGRVRRAGGPYPWLPAA